MEQTFPGIDLSERCHVAESVRFPSSGICLPGPGSPHPSEPTPSSQASLVCSSKAPPGKRGSGACPHLEMDKWGLGFSLSHQPISPGHGTSPLHRHLSVSWDSVKVDGWVGGGSGKLESKSPGNGRREETFNIVT